MKNIKFLLTVFLLAIAAATPVPHAYSSTLAVTVFTDRPSYIIAESITVCGNLTYNGSPVSNWPVALEVQDPTGTPVVTRTPQTDTNGTYNVTFKLPANAELGTYTVYVSSSYKGEMALNNATFELIPVRDVAVTNLTPSKTLVGQGYSISINATAENQGEITETFDVTVYANTTPVASQNVHLTAGNSVNVTFTWNTAGFAYGNYSITAYAALPGDMNMTNNNSTDGIVKVSILGDVVTPYFKVDMGDVSAVLDAFGSKLGPDGNYWHHPPGILDPFSPNMDIDCNGQVDMGDVTTALDHFGQHYP